MSGPTAGDVRPQPAAIALRNVVKSFGRVQVLHDLTLEIREGEFFSLLGPSGCGKTTSLRVMAGFEDPDTGSVLLRGEDVTRLPPNKRSVNMVFQNYELFPHMTVFENVAYGLKIKKVGEPELSQRVLEMLDVVRVTGLERRGARQLSGGQQQRIALARALVNRPAVLLLDEPLSALDVKLRRQMQLELKAIQHRLGTTFVYVTHDQEEALLMSDRIGIMSQGRLLQVDTPRRIYTSPADAFVADFVGSLNTLEFRIDGLIDGRSTMNLGPGQRLVASVADGAGRGDRRTAAIRPERVRLVGPLVAVPEDEARLEGSIESADYVGAITQYRVTTSAGSLLVNQLNDSGMPDREVGTEVVVSWPADAAFLLP